MRIGMVCYPGLGGSGIVASELADRLARRGHRVFLFATELPMRLPEDSPVQFMPVEVPHYPVFPAPLYTLALAGAWSAPSGKSTSSFSIPTMPSPTRWLPSWPPKAAFRWCTRCTAQMLLCWG